MPNQPHYDPAWSAYRHVVKLRFNTEQLNRIDQLSVEHGVSRAWLLRAAIAEGLPRVFDHLEGPRTVGLTVRGARARGRSGDRYSGRRRKTLVPVVMMYDVNGVGPSHGRRGVASPGGGRLIRAQLLVATYRRPAARAWAGCLSS